MQMTDNGLALARTLACQQIAKVRDFFLKHNADCPVCEGQGTDEGEPCLPCRGKGTGPDYEPEMVQTLTEAHDFAEAALYSRALPLLRIAQGYFEREPGNPLEGRFLAVSIDLDTALGQIKAIVEAKS